MSNLPSIQERLQLKRVPLDKWSVKEKLCLASAVACSGDQNWMSVSRALKMLCGANRPGDWFSQKSCAAQYGKLLENVETPKRKKRTNSERDGVASVETPGENILRKLTQERIIELKKIIQEEAQQYTKVKEDIILIQSGVTDEKKLREMWKQIELEKAQKEKEQLLHAQWLKEREEKKLELERQWRPAYPGSPNSTKPSVQVTTVKVKEETDEDSQSSSKSGTSPLLTSLLKSPTSNQAGTPGMQAVVGRSPSITNLLTGNSPGMNIQGKNLFPTAGSTSTQLQDEIKPIEGTSSYQIAPNLTKLLDTKQQVVDDKPTVSGDGAAQVDKAEDMEIDADNVDPAKDLMAVFQELMPEELVEILNENNGMILEDEILDNVVDSIMEEEAESLKGKDLSALQQSSVTSPEDAEPNADETVPKNEERTPEVVKGAYLKPAAAAPSPPPPVGEPTDVKQEKFEEGTAAAEEPAEKAGDTQEGQLKQPLEEQVIKEEVPESKPSDTIPVEDSTTNSPITNPSSVDNKEENEEQNDPGVIVVSDSAKEEDSPSEVKTDMEEDSDDRPLASLETKPEPMDEVKEEDSETCSSDDKSLASMPEPKPVEEVKPSTSEEEAARAKKEALEKLAAEYDFKDDEEPIVPLSIQKSKEEKHVPEEEIFMDALDNLEESEDTKEAEPKKPDEPLVTVTDTDDDSLIEMKISKTKRDYSRRRPLEDSFSKLRDDPPSTPKNDDPSEQGRTLRKLRDRDRDRSESPFVFIDDDVSEKMKRSYSSTPVIDSIPNSPASSEDRDYRAWKKSILTIHSKISSLRYASAFLKPLPEDQSTELVFRPMDLSTIKKNIENGTIRTTAEYQRDIMLICTNATMLNQVEICSPTAARVLLKESVVLIETMMEGGKSGGAGAREKEPEARVGGGGGGSGGSGSSSANKRSSRKGTMRSSTSGSRI
uniref:Bromodomain-containing protein 8 n=1 Tax=Culex pipiens TaxID=7175 RepID=A0A8D8D196_CULPI